MLKFILIMFLLASHAFASSKEEARALIQKYSSETELSKRMELFSKSFLGLPYGFSGPLGEGPTGRYDQDPLYRFDTFDCTTFVETIISLALSRNIDEFEHGMNEIRYEKGKIDYLTRNHFPSLQWIPNNVQNGLLKEINDQVLPSNEQALAEAIINLPGWLRSIKVEEIRVPEASLNERMALAEELHSLAASYSPILAQLKYIPISTLLARPSLLTKISHGTVVNFVRPNWDTTAIQGTHMNVSHQGFLFRIGATLYLRHASSSGTKTVLDQPFLEYLKKFENHPTLKGIHLMQVNI